MTRSRSRCHCLDDATDVHHVEQVQLACGPRSVCMGGVSVLAQRSARRRWLSAVEAVSITRASDFAEARLRRVNEPRRRRVPMRRDTLALSLLMDSQRILRVESPQTLAHVAVQHECGL